MEESELLARIALLCMKKKLLWHHCPDSRECQGQPGFPDLIVVGTKGIIIAELKSKKGETTAEQDLWLWTLNEANSGCAPDCESRSALHVLWRPDDLLDGTIAKQLSDIV